MTNLPSSRPPLVSVILPTYNRSATLDRAISSVIKQDLTDFELLVVDDASVDDTADVVGKYADPRVEYIKLPTNRGAHGARNVGIARAKGRYIAFQDSDDECLPGKLRALVKAIDSCPSARVAFVRGRSVRRDGQIRLVPGKYKLPRSVCTGFLDLLLEGSMIGTPLLLVERELLREVGGFDESRTHLMEDWDLCIRLAKKTAFAFADEIQHIAYMNADSISATGRREEIDAIEQILAKHHQDYIARPQALAMQLARLAVYALEIKEYRAASGFITRSIVSPEVGVWLTVRAISRLSSMLIVKRLGN